MLAWVSWNSHNLTTVSSDAELVEDCVAEERFWILRNPKAPRAHWQGLTRTSIKTITSLTVSLASRHLQKSAVASQVWRNYRVAIKPFLLLLKLQMAHKKFCGIFWITERCTTISRLHMLKVWRKNFEISVKLSFSATSLFTRAMWGGRSCSSAVVPLVGSCFALQQSWIIFSVPSQCYILFHFTLNLATFITLYCTADTNFTPRSENNSIHSTLKVHI